MAIVLALSATFAVSIVAPWATRGLGRLAGWGLAIVPATIAAWLLSIAPSVVGGDPVRARIEWAPSLGLDLSFAIDGLGLLFGLLIAGVGSLVLIYARGYLGPHPGTPRLLAFLLLFMGSMLGVVWSENLLGLFVFW
ncbi:MAG: hypothetical protein ACO3SJ_11945, partial [Phycisphaerales bacterium]